MTERKRIGTILLCVGLVLALTVSSVFIAVEADHDCSGEECPVCRMIAVNIHLLRMLSLTVFALAALFSLLPVRSARGRRDRHIHFFSGTLVSLKIRLND